VKFIVDNWYLIVFALVTGGMLLWPTLKGASVAGLAPNALVQMINRDKAVVVDVSEAAEFAAGHVVGSKNVPLAELEAKLGSAVKNKKLPLVLVCQTGTRSTRALAAAKKLGYEQSFSLGGGLAAWKAAGLPLEKA
jgi:rhodanese-related sulfurtransferase